MFSAARRRCWPRLPKVSAATKFVLNEAIPPIRRMLLLRHTPGLPDVEQATLATIAEMMCVRSFAAGEALLKPGKPAAAMYHVVEGRVRIERRGRFFRTVVPRRAPVGVMAMYGRDPDGINAVAEVDTVALQLRADDMFDLLEQRSSVRIAVIRSVARELLARRRELGYGGALRPSAATDVVLSGNDFDLVQRVELLRQMFVMASFRITAALELARHTHVLSVPEGTELWAAGDDADDFLMLLNGQVECATAAGDVFEFGARDAVGLVAVLADARRDYAARARTRVTALRIPGFVFIDLMREYAEFGLEALGTTANAVFDIYERLAAVGHADPEIERESVTDWLQALL